MTEKLDKKNDRLFPFQTYTFRNTNELEMKCPNTFDMMLKSEHEHELWIGNINGLVSPTSEYGLAIKLKRYIIAKKKLTFILPENYTAIRPDNGSIGFRKTVLDMIRLGESHKQITIFTYSIEHAEDDINKILEKFNEAKMKFNVAILNPPYDRNLHLKILEKVILLADKVVNISPIRWLQDPLVNFKKSTDYKMFENSISKKIESLDIIPVDTATDIFNAKMPSDMGIYLCKNDINNNLYKQLVNPIIIKVLNQINNWPIFETNKKDGWRVRIPTVVDTVGGNYCKTKKNLSSIGKVLYFLDGKKDSKYWFEFYNKNQFTKTTPEITNSIKFDDEITAKNFCESYNTKFVQYYTHYVKVDVHVYPETILWVKDYTQPWDDKRFCEYFGITGYIDDDHSVPGSEWETILKTIEQYK